MPPWLANLAGPALTMDASGAAQLAAVEDRAVPSADVVLMPLLREGVILASGEDSQAFLQALLSNDVDAVAESRSIFAAYCTPKGRVLATMVVARAADGYALHLPLELVEPIRKRLQMYVLRSRVRLEEPSPELAFVGLAGSQAATALRGVLGVAPAASYDVVTDGGISAIMLPGDRILLSVPIAKIEVMWNALVRLCALAGQDAWDWHAIAAGVPQITWATSDQFVPQMLNLELLGGIAFDKGCYPGQEIVARAQYRGQVKRRLHRFASSAGTAPGSSLYLGEQSVGTVINAAPAPGANHELLAVVPTDTDRTALRLGHPASARLQELPLPYSLPSAETHQLSGPA